MTFGSGASAALSSPTAERRSIRRSSAINKYLAEASRENLTGPDDLVNEMQSRYPIRIEDPLEAELTRIVFRSAGPCG